MFKWTMVLAAFVAASIVGACADKSAKISATYVSPIKYSSFTCLQMEQEYGRILQESQMMNKQQDDIAGNDSVAMGVGLILFWPALFFIDSDDKKEEVGRLKGELRALDQSTIQKNCTVLAQTIASDKEAAAKATEEKRKAQQKINEGIN